MGYNFRPVERDQQYLLAPSLRDWLPEGDLAWVVIDAVEQLDLTRIRDRYRTDGWGAAAYDPAMMVALLLYAYAQGERSSRQIETRCRRDIGYRVISANQLPDHATIARFRADHEEALGELFGQVLRVCAEAGLGRLGVVALDGTKMGAATSLRANRAAAGLDAEIARMLQEAAAVDAAEDAAHGPDHHGDELPAGLARRSDRLARFQEARRQLAEAETEALHQTHETRRYTRPPRPPGERPDRTPSGRRRTTPLERRLGWTQRNPTDPDSRKMKAAGGWIQGYNGQAVVAEDGLVLAAELTQDANDSRQLLPMLEHTRSNLATAGVRRPIGTLLADAGYWSELNVTTAEASGGPRLLIAPMRPTTASTRAAFPTRARMHRRLKGPSGRARYRRRGAIVEPVFGELKEVRRARRFSRRGLAACRSEWRLLCATHNLLKLWRHRLASGPTGAPSRSRPQLRTTRSRPRRSPRRRSR